MRQVQVQDAAEHFADLIAEAEAGESLTIVKAGRPVAQIVPFRADNAEVFSDAERIAARKELRTVTAQGFDLGIVWNGRDELYDRD